MAKFVTKMEYGMSTDTPRLITVLIVTPGKHSIVNDW